MFQFRRPIGNNFTCKSGVLQLVAITEPGEVLQVLPLQLELPALRCRLQLTLEGPAQLWVLTERLHLTLLVIHLLSIE